MKKLILIVIGITFVCGIASANPYMKAIQKARNVRSQVEHASNPENHFKEGERQVNQKINTVDTKIKQEIPNAQNTVQQEVEKAVKECVCPDCKLVYQAKLREKNTKGKIKYVPPKCPCLTGGKCPERVKK